MDLERMTAKVRPRKGWEAIDLGVAFVQQHAGSLYKIWFLITLPVFLIGALVFVDYYLWPIIVFWFLLPIFERPMLHFLSRELFGERLTVKQCVKEFFNLAKIQWFASLTWRRLSFTRSLDLPIIQLEGLRGAQRSQRIKVIHSIGSGTAVWLTIFFVFLEFVFYYAFIVLAYLFLPQQITESIDVWQWIWMELESPWTDFLMNLVAYFAISIVAPFFTACGFALYINQRTHLEAWDIELSFKRLAKRLAEQGESPVVRLASILMACFLSFLIFKSEPLYAAENDQQSSQQEATQQQAGQTQDKQSQPETIEEITHDNAKTLIQDILQGDSFNQVEQDYRLKRRFDTDKKKEKQIDETSSGFSAIGYYLAKFISFVVEFALWVVVAVIIIFLITRYHHLITGLSPNLSRKKSRPKQLFGLDMSSEDLPDQPWQVAASLIQEKQYREALSLLYRASLIWYIDHTDVIIKEGDTELECLAKLKSYSNQFAHQYLSQLTSSWRRLAYAHQIPESSVLEELCQQWPKAYEVKRETEATDEA